MVSCKHKHNNKHKRVPVGWSVASVPLILCNVHANKQNKTISFLKFRCETVQLCSQNVPLLQLLIIYLVRY